MVVPRANEGLSSGGVNPAAGVTCPKALPAARKSAIVARRVRSLMLHLPPCWRGDSWPADTNSDAVVCKFRVKEGESLEARLGSVAPMAYELPVREPIPDAVLRVMREQIDRIAA